MPRQDEHSWPQAGNRPADHSPPMRFDISKAISAEALRGSTSPNKPEDKSSVLLRTLAGTFVSVVAIAVIAVCQTFAANLQELRAEIIRLSETRSDLVRRDEFNNRCGPLESNGPVVIALKEKLSLVQEQLKSGEEERKSLVHEVQQLHERIAVMASQLPANSPVKLSDQDQKTNTPSVLRKQ